MNGKKIILITTLVASIILISLTMLFARFVLQIDFTGNDTQQTLENTSGETSSQPQEEDQQTEPSVDQPQSPSRKRKIPRPKMKIRMNRTRINKKIQMRSRQPLLQNPPSQPRRLPSPRTMAPSS